MMHYPLSFMAEHLRQNFPVTLLWSHKAAKELGEREMNGG
jgi:hypothetical protein